MRMPTSMPAEPSMRIVPWFIPRAPPRYAAPTCPPAFPRIRIRPPVISAPSQSETLPVTSMAPPFMEAPRCIPTSPATVIRPRVIPRPIHFTRLRSPRSASSSLAAPSISKKSSRRRCRFPRSTGNARMASWLRPAITSGEMRSASRGTLGRSFRVREIMTGRPGGSWPLAGG